MKIGFIGLGNMGGPMATNLAVAGHDVIGFDVAPAQVEGVSMVPTAQDAASGRDVVITMLPDGAILRQVAAAGGPDVLKTFHEENEGIPTLPEEFSFELHTSFMDD